MSIESEFFRKTVFNLDRLRSAALREDREGFHISQPLLDGKFRAELVVSPSGSVAGKVIETELGEEYLPLHALGQKGAFVTRVRLAYLRFLQDVASKYGIQRYFASEQLNRIADWIYEAFGERPDFPFKKDRDHAVFRSHENGKWYMLCSLLKGEENELVNVKVDKSEVASLLLLPGFLPAYHMNKRTWISIRMDGTVDDELVRDLIRESRAMTIETVEDKNVWHRWRRR